MFFLSKVAGERELSTTYVLAWLFTRMSQKLSHAPMSWIWRTLPCCAVLSHYKFLLKVLIHSLKLQVSPDRVSWKATPLFCDIKELLRSLEVCHTGGWRVMQSITMCLTSERCCLEPEHWYPNQILCGFTWGVSGCLLEMVTPLPCKGRLNGWGFEFKKELCLMEEVQISYSVKGRRTWNYNLVCVAIWKWEHTQLNDWV